MGKKLILVMFLLVFSLVLVSSAPPVTTVQEFPDGYVIVESSHTYLKLNQYYQYNFFVYNKSNGLLIDNSFMTCNFFLANSSGEVIFRGESVYFSDGHWGIDILGGNFSSIGSYPYGVSCQDGNGGALAGIFEVTYTGKDLSTSQAILYGFFLTLLVLTFLSCFVGMNFLPARNQTDEEGKLLSISYLKYFRNVLGMIAYFLFIGINYISSNLAFAFLDEELIAQTLFMIFKVSFGLAPVVVIVWIIWIIVSMFHDKQFQQLLNRGIFPQGRI